MACQPPFKVFGQIAGGAVTRSWFALQTFCTNGLQIAVESRGERPQFRGRLFRGLLNHSKRMLAEEWWPAGEKIKQDCPKTINVRRRCDFASRPACLFKSDIAGRAENRQRLRKLAGSGPVAPANRRHNSKCASTRRCAASAVDARDK